MFDHNIFQENLVGVDYCERMVKETNPGVLELANRTEAPHAGDHGYRTIGDIMRSLNPLEGDFYREALHVSRYTREMFCLMEGRHVHPSTLYPGGVGTVATIQLFTDYLTRLMRYVEFMKKVVPLHDDLFDFFYEALPGYEHVGERRILLGCWGSLNDPAICDFRYQTMADWGRRMFVTPGVVVDGKLVTNNLVDINLGLRILLGSSYYDDWAGGGRRSSSTSTRSATRSTSGTRGTSTRCRKPQKRDFSNAYSWTMSPRWFDGKDHLALDTGGGPIARLWSTALSGLVNTATSRPPGTASRSSCPGPRSSRSHRYEWKIPRWSNAIERNRARTYFQAYAAALALHFCEKAMAEVRAGQTETWTPFKVPDEAICVRLHRGGPRRALAPHGDPRRQDRELPPVPADAVERQRPGHLRHAGTVRGRGPEHADLRGEPAGPVQGHRHHAGGPQLRPVPAVRRAHVRRQRAEKTHLHSPSIAVKPY